MLPLSRLWPWRKWMQMWNFSFFGQLRHCLQGLLFIFCCLSFLCLLGMHWLPHAWVLPCPCPHPLLVTHLCLSVPLDLLGSLDFSFSLPAHFGSFRSPTHWNFGFPDSFLGLWHSSQSYMGAHAGQTYFPPLTLMVPLLMHSHGVISHLHSWLICLICLIIQQTICCSKKKY